jgi:class 3 adenylate cyclase
MTRKAIIVGALFFWETRNPVLAAEPFAFISPPDPLPWTIVTLLIVVLAFLGGLVLYMLRIILGDKTVALAPEFRKRIEKGYAEKLSDDFKVRDEKLKEGLKNLRARFSLVFMKVRNLTSTLDPEKIFKAILDIFTQEVEAQQLILFLHDREKNELYPYRWAGYGDRDPLLVPLPMGTDHLLTYAFKKRQVVYRLHAVDDPETRGLIDREPIKTTLVAVPLATQSESLGVIHIESFASERQEIIDEDLKFFSALSSFMGLALSNAHVLLQTRDELTSTKKVTEKELAEKKRLKDMFSRYASTALVDTLLQNPGSVNLGGTQKNASVLFSDIVGFTNFSSHLSPQEVVNVMNEYLSVMAEVVLNHQGEIDKFIGDAVMARFGVLVDLPAPGLSAVRTALAMLDELKKLQAKWAQEHRECFRIRIGIASGPVLAGNIGSERRQEFTVMGATVNLASRLEGLNKDLNTVVLIDENTFRQCSGEVRAEPRENITIRGLEETMTVYEVVGYHDHAQAGTGVASFREKLSATKAVKPLPPALPEQSSEETLEPKPVALPDMGLLGLLDMNDKKE